MIYISSVCFSQTISEPAKEKNASDATQPIKGWRISADSARLNYDVFLDTTVRYAGNAGASIKSKVADATRKGALMQTIKADDYIGKRMRLSVYAKAENAEYAALWMRMDGDGMKVMNTDTMEKRPIKGTSDWRQYEIVLDVPEGSHQIVFGAILRGGGQIWIDEIKFEEVGQNVPVTSPKLPSETQKGSAKYIEQYKMTNKEDYEKQLKAFYERNRSVPLSPVNLGFEN